MMNGATEPKPEPAESRPWVAYTNALIFLILTAGYLFILVVGLTRD